MNRIEENTREQQERRGLGAGDYGPAKFSEIIGYSEILMLCWKIFGLMLFVRTKILNFVGKSLNLALQYSAGATTPLESRTLKKNDKVSTK